MRRMPAALALAVASCQDAPVRPQLVLYVDVDMPVTSQARDDVSPDALFDSLRIEVLDGDDELIAARVFSIANADALPLAFAIPSEVTASGNVTVHLRAFRAAFAKNGQQGGEPILDPRGEVSVDRLVSLSLPTEGILRRSVLLSGDCIGIPVSFGKRTTCVDADRLEASVSDGIDDGAPGSTVAGSWPLARVVPCSTDSAPAAGAKCIPGGFSVLGDPLYLARHELERDALPLRPVRLSPFYMDETEVTVGTFRELLENGYAGPLPLAKDEGDLGKLHCTWSPESDAAMPLNCASLGLAEAVCAMRGGFLPSEAQWEYAARGRGRRTTFVWGESTPECCTSNIGYSSQGTCLPWGPAPVGSHLGGDACAGDESLDGIRDLNGSLSEVVSDSIANFSDDCWASSEGSAILQDWTCDGAPGHMSRGASWQVPIGDAPLPIRRSFVEQDPGYGFRCVYAAGFGDPNEERL